MKKTVFISKYWETKGIYKLECELFTSIDGETVNARNGYYVSFGPKDYHHTEEEASRSVRIKAINKIQSLNKKIEKIKSKWL